MKHRQTGFSFVELSVALVALGIVLLAAMAYWQLTASQRVAAVQQTVQKQSRDAVVGFLYANFRLPCPAVDANGLENCTGAGSAVRHTGLLPWRTLGLPRPEAGRLRYAVYRESSGSAPDDRDLTTARDRMNPLRVATPNPRPLNSATAPNGTAPPFPVATAALLGATQSGLLADPLSPACNPSSSPPCPAPVNGTSSTNMIDVCLALNTASGLSVAPATSLGVLGGGIRRPMAFVVVAPGLLDADRINGMFDGLNATASDDNPTYEPSSRAKSDEYDDQVLAVSHTELFSELNCGTGLAAAAHAHFATAIGAFTLERALYDYRDQLYISKMLADAGVAASVAGDLSAAVGVAEGTQAVISSTADAFASAGARAFQIAISAAALVSAGIGLGAAIASTVLAVLAQVDAVKTHAEFAERTDAITTLSISINRNALLADAIGF